MPIVGVEEEVEGDPLLGAPAVQPEGVAVAAHEADLLVGPTRPSPDPRGEMSLRPVWHGRSAAATLSSRPYS